MDNKGNLVNLILELSLDIAETELYYSASYQSYLPRPPFYLTISARGELSSMGNSEIVLVTSTNYPGRLSIVRGQKNTSPRSFKVGDVASSGIYAEAAPAVGDIIMTLNATPAPGRLFMNGDQYSRSDYPLLYEHVRANASYGVATSDDFTLTDMRTRMPVGAGASYALGATGGEEKHTLTGDELPNGKFYLGFHGDGDSTVLSSVTSSGAVKDIPRRYNRYRSGGGGTAGAQSVGNVSFEFGADQAHNNMPPYIVVNYEVIAG